MGFVQQAVSRVRAILRGAANLPSPALGEGQLDQGDLVVAADIPALFWTNGDGHIVPRSLVQLGGAFIQGPVNIFVNSITGNDSNAGTAANPVLSLTRAFQLAALTNGQLETTVTLQNIGFFNLAPDQVLDVPFPIGQNPPMRLVGQRKTLGTFAATGGTTGSFLPLAAATITGAFPAGAFTKQYGTWLTGANTGARFPIISNTATTAVCDASFGLAPAPGDQFSVDAAGSIIVGATTAVFQGGPIILEDLTFDIPPFPPIVGLHQDIGLSFQGCAYVQENAVTYLARLGGAGSVLACAPRTVSGASDWFINQPSCGCIYDGSGGTELLLAWDGINESYSNALLDTCTLALRRPQAPAGKVEFVGIGSMNACGIGLEDGAVLEMDGILCSNMHSPASSIAIGPGTIAGRIGSMIRLVLCDFQTSGGPGVPLVSLDQGKGVLNLISGTNPAASNVLSLKSDSSCSVASITVTDVTAGSTATVGGNAAATTISGVVPATTDLTSAAPQLCLVSAPT